jgi:hypothetical protein
VKVNLCFQQNYSGLECVVNVGWKERVDRTKGRVFIRYYNCYISVPLVQCASHSKASSIQMHRVLVPWYTPDEPMFN